MVRTISDAGTVISDGGTPDLELVDRATAIGERHFGHLCQLVFWHEEDPVDDAERRPQ